MDSSPRRWVLKPLSPLLQPSDLRTIVGPSSESAGQSSVVISSLQGEGSQDGGSTSDEWSPGSPGSSVGSHSGFYSFVEDPTSPEAELNEAWMVSSRRQAQLATLKEEPGFKLQTYNSCRRPDSLFPNGNGDSCYLVGPDDGVEVVGEEEEKRLRKEIISTQAPKKSPVIRDRPSLILDLDLRPSSNASHSPVSFKPQPLHLAEPPSVDKEQINFNAVRQQFLRMEQDRLAALLSPTKSPKSSSMQLNTSVSSTWKKTSTSGEEPRSMRQFKVEEKDLQRQGRMFGTGGSLWEQSRICEDLDSGPQVLSVDVTSDAAVRDSVFTSSSETPIQREIRLVQEREENLRRSRGLKLSESQPEMVQIKTKRLQSPLTPLRAKDRNRVSFFSQKEAQSQNLGESGSDPPLGETRGNESQPSGEAWRTEVGVPAEAGFGEVSLSPCCPHTHPEEARFSQKSPPSFTDVDSGVRDTKGFVLDHRSSWSSTGPQFWREKLESSGLQARGQGAPDFIEKEIEESVRREQELRKLRESREEIQPLSPAPVVVQAVKTSIGPFSSPGTTDKAVSLSSARPSLQLSSVSFITAQPWTSSPPPPLASSPMFETPAPPAQRGLTETLMHDFEERRSKLRLEESSYAGIQLVDNINNEVVESTRVIRHKNRRALLWEAGEFANQEHQ